MRTNHQGQRRHPSASTGRRHDRARDVHNSFKATLDHGAPSRHDRYLRIPAEDPVAVKQSVRRATVDVAAGVRTFVAL